MINTLLSKRNTKKDEKIKITRLKEMNIVNNEFLKSSEKLAKAYNIHI
ncbi:MULTISPECIES: hypothetical protein [Aquimarina]|nr:MULTISPECIES: hypothetical protein [Aquimarina]